jgi:hypothetical protein
MVENHSAAKAELGLALEVEVQGVERMQAERPGAAVPVEVEVERHLGEQRERALQVKEGPEAEADIIPEAEAGVDTEQPGVERQTGVAMEVQILQVTVEEQLPRVEVGVELMDLPIFQRCSSDPQVEQVEQTAQTPVMVGMEEE